MSFQGSVESFSLADVFQNLASKQLTGTLRIFASEGQERHVYFENGQLKALSRGRDKPLLLGEVLVARGLVDESQLNEALARQHETRERLGACLASLGFVTEEQVGELVAHQVTEEVFELFAWEKAQFEFLEGPPADGLFVDSASSRLAGLPVAALIMEAARRVDEWGRLRAQVPSFSEIYVVDSAAREALDSGAVKTEAVEKRVLSLLDGRRDVDDVIREACLFRYETLAALAGFLQSSLVRPAQPAELLAAAEQLRGGNTPEKLAKVLERLLTQGEDRPDLRLTLAETLIEIGQPERAAIHLSVLAEAELAAGKEDGAVALYRRILQEAPEHVPSRQHLGALYLKRAQKREALVQFQELSRLYQAREQWAEARAACQQALKCDPACHEARRELAQILETEGHAAEAARECEILGDQLAKQGQAKAAAGQYRRAGQLLPSAKHLKKKLANVMLTKEDRRQQRRRALEILGLAILLLAAVWGLGWRELRMTQRWGLAESRAGPSLAEARRLEGLKDYARALPAYKRALRFYEESDVARSRSLFDTAQQARLVIADVEQRMTAAEQSLRQQAQATQQEARNLVGAAQRAVLEGDFYLARERSLKALALFQKAVDEGGAAERSESAEEVRANMEQKIKAFEDGRKRALHWPEGQATGPYGVEAEFKFKKEFLESYRNLPELKAELAQESEARKYYLPVRVVPSEYEVKVFVNGKFQRTIGRQGDVFRFPPGTRQKVELRKDGYKTQTLVADESEAVREAVLEREPALLVDLGHRLAGDALYDGTSVWIGTEGGSLLQLDPQTFSRVVEYPSPVPQGMLRDVYGPLVSFASGGRRFIVYTTRAGDCVALEPGKETPPWPVRKATEQPCAPPALLKLSEIGEQLLCLAPVGNRLRGFSVEHNEALWGHSYSATVEAPLTTTPIVVRSADLDAKTLLVVGAENGNLYGFRVADGTLARTWQGEQRAIQGQLVTAEGLLAANDAKGDLLFFSTRGGPPLGKVALNGAVGGLPLIRRNTLFAGTQLRSGFVAVDLATRALATSFRESLHGGVATGPTMNAQGDRIYFGTDSGWFHAVQWKDEAFARRWSYQAADGHRVVSAPLLLDGRVVFFCDNGKVYAFTE